MALVGSPYVLQLNRNANPGLLTERGTSYLPDAARRILPLQQNCRVISALVTGRDMPIARHVMPNFLPQSNCDRALGHTPERGTAGYPPLYSGFEKHLSYAFRFFGLLSRRCRQNFFKKNTAHSIHPVSHIIYEPL